MLIIHKCVDLELCMNKSLDAQRVLVDGLHLASEISKASPSPLDSLNDVSALVGLSLTWGLQGGLRQVVTHVSHNVHVEGPRSTHTFLFFEMAFRYCCPV